MTVARIVIHVVCDEGSVFEKALQNECLIAHREMPNSVYIDSSQSLASWQAEQKPTKPAGPATEQEKVK